MLFMTNNGIIMIHQNKNAIHKYNVFCNELLINKNSINNLKEKTIGEAVNYELYELSLSALEY